MKIDMYQKVPEEFHEKLMDTLEKLEDSERKPVKGKKRFSAKRIIILAAAAVLVFGTMTAGAVRLFGWQEAAAERFQVEKELEEKLTAQGVATEENAVTTEGEITLQALQTVRSAHSYYILLRVTVPEGIALDGGDVLFDSMEASSGKAFDGGVCNVIADSIEGNSFLCEVELLTSDGVDYTGEEVVLKFRDLIRTIKTEQVGEPLVAGEWEMALTLTAQLPETREYYAECPFKWGKHTVTLYGVRADAFCVELIVDREEALHAGQNHMLMLSGVVYEDGTVVQEDIAFLQTGDDGNGNLVYSVSLEEIGEGIDVDQISALLLDDGEEEIVLNAVTANALAGKNMAAENEVNEFAETGSGTAPQTGSAEEELPWKGREESASALYVSHNGYAVIADGSLLYLWDITCGKVERQFDLSEINYDPEKGEILVGAGGHMAFVYPEMDGDTMYILRFEDSAEGWTEGAAKSLSEEQKEIYRSYRTDMREMEAQNGK